MSDDIFSTDDHDIEVSHCMRYEELSGEFPEEVFEFFNENPEFTEDPYHIIIVPGRVNLIGEHVDYSGYGVIPMALEHNIQLMVKGNDKSGSISLRNMDPKYKAVEIKQPFSWSKPPSWYHYIQCGIQGALNKIPGPHTEGYDILVNGNIPPGAGLSSSSALVCAAALCPYLVKKTGLHSKKVMAELCAEAEHLIGTQGGGMDQAVAFYGKQGCAKRIEFNPLRCQDVELPRDAIFVIANSLVEKNKAASNDFNMRVVECRMAAQVIAKKCGLEWRKIKKLKDVQTELKRDILEMVSLTESMLDERSYSKEEIANILEISVEELVKISLSPDTKDEDIFHLKKRARHVFTEVVRVRKFMTCSKEFPDEEKCLAELGKLMSESHMSLKENYECSHEKLDRLVEISKRYTFGCKLTGAGWGGCMVALTKEENVEEYKAALKKEFYFELGDTDFDKAVFVTKPHGGARVISIKNFHHQNKP